MSTTNRNETLQTSAHEFNVGKKKERAESRWMKLLTVEYKAGVMRKWNDWYEY